MDVGFSRFRAPRLVDAFSKHFVRFYGSLVLFIIAHFVHFCNFYPMEAEHIQNQYIKWGCVGCLNLSNTNRFHRAYPPHPLALATPFFRGSTAKRIYYIILRIAKIAKVIKMSEKQ